MKLTTLFKTLAVMCIMAALLISSSFALPAQSKEVTRTPEPTALPTATPEPIDWREYMVKAVCHADNHGGLEAEYALGGAIKYDDLYLLAKIITWECGPNWEDWGIIAGVVGRLGGLHPLGAIRPAGPAAAGGGARLWGQVHRVPSPFSPGQRSGLHLP